MYIFCSMRSSYVCYHYCCDYDYYYYYYFVVDVILLVFVIAVVVLLLLLILCRLSSPMLLFSFVCQSLQHYDITFRRICCHVADAIGYSTPYYDTFPLSVPPLHTIVRDVFCPSSTTTRPLFLWLLFIYCYCRVPVNLILLLLLLLRHNSAATVPQSVLSLYPCLILMNTKCEQNEQKACNF